MVLPYRGNRSLSPLVAVMIEGVSSLLTACAVLSHGSTQSIPVTSALTGTDFYINGEYQGVLAPLGVYLVLPPQLVS